MNAPVATIDFETRSACVLKRTGSWRYSLDSSTQVLCLAYRLPYWDPGQTALWHPDFPHLGIEDSTDYDERLELWDWINDGEAVEAHNAWFERGIWKNIMLPFWGWPMIQSHQWRCSAAKAAAHALPRKLEQVIAALDLPVLKDAEGHKLMMKLSKPRKARKKEREAVGFDPRVPLWWESVEMFERLWQYCRQDVLAEDGVSHRLDDLSEDETTMYLLDQTINERGFQLDPKAVQAAQKLIAKESVYLNRELRTITDGTVERATQREQIKGWCETQGVKLYDTQAATLDELLENAAKDEEQQEELPPWVTIAPTHVRRVIEIVRMLGRSSTAKYDTMSAWACPDWRVRGSLLYHGATTGRWSGAGVQPHNFPKGKLKDWDMEAAWEVLIRAKRTEIMKRWGSVMEPLAQALRGAIVPTPGKRIFVADYASIEARVLLWLARDKENIGIFERNEDIYLSMASEIYARLVTKADKEERQLGKAAVLGCGYQMGPSKFVDTAAMYGVTITEEFSQRVVDAYREKFWRVKAFWGDIERAAIRAVTTGHRTICGLVAWELEGDFLFCRLPSGRRLAYPFPELREKTTPWGATMWGLTFMGINAYSHKWQRQTTYGGMLVENVTQAVSRDLMAEAMLRAERSGIYEPILSVHDELIAEAALDQGDVHEFEQLMAQRPPWATGCPVAAEGWVGTRYRK